MTTINKPLKIEINFDGSTIKTLLDFISDTQEGKFTAQKPDLTQITYKRLEIQEQSNSHSPTDSNNEILLFGNLF
ncbi:MAG: hypothetical protein ABIA75_09570 [Candidatus Neomarinimicrobiota bacterium]